MTLPPPPDPRDLLPPLLACLPTAFVSPQPPPALLPLLSPLLRQRLTYLSSSPTPTRTDGWLPLLSWDGSRAAKLPPVVERMHLEPHPVSGEVELEDVRPAKYRRLDEETLQSRLEVEQFELLPIFVWCETDEHGQTGPGWKLAELRSLEDVEDGTEWYASIPEATDAASTSAIPQIRQEGNHQPHHPQTRAGGDGGDEEDDGDYWASYDRTPGRTPATKHSPAPPAPTSHQTNRQRTHSELDYYARYGSEVQPAMDAHDPDEDNPEITASSTLNGSSLLPPPQQQQQQQQQQQRSSLHPPSRPNGTSLYPSDPPPDPTIDDPLTAPRPLSSASSNTSSIERLETAAAELSAAASSNSTGGYSRNSDRAQMAVKQHISTDVKSLFRLAKSSGMSRGEFERIVRVELECLGMMEEGE